jgi:hypothetical protein
MHSGRSMTALEAGPRSWCDVSRTSIFLFVGAAALLCLLENKSFTTILRNAIVWAAGK